MQARSSEHGRLGLIKPNIWKAFGHPSYKPFKTTSFPIPVKVKNKSSLCTQEKTSLLFETPAQTDGYKAAFPRNAPLKWPWLHEP